MPGAGVSYDNVHQCLAQVDPTATADVYSLLNLFSGGALLQLTPYITSSMIVQLLPVILTSSIWNLSIMITVMTTGTAVVRMYGGTPGPDQYQSFPFGGSVSGELGLRRFLESQGHELVVTSDKEGPDSEFDRHLADAEIVISQPFWPAYVTAERIAKAPKLKLAVTAGIGSDHVDLAAAISAGVTVAEVTYCNSISVAEHVVMMIVSMVRNHLPAHQIVRDGGWNIADAVARSYDVEGMHIGTVAAGRIGLAVLRRLTPFDVHLHYTDRHRLPADVEEELGLTFHADVREMVPHLDVVTINAPLHPETRNLFDEQLLGTMKRGAYLINTARALIVDRAAVVRSLESGQLAGYAGDVWYPQPAPADHPWRTMPHHGMTPHISGSSLSAQARYAGRDPRDPRVLLHRHAHPGRVPDRRRRRPRRHRRPLLQRQRLTLVRSGPRNA